MSLQQLHSEASQLQVATGGTPAALRFCTAVEFVGSPVPAKLARCSLCLQGQTKP
jgi:hypothetical protein